MLHRRAPRETPEEPTKEQTPLLFGCIIQTQLKLIRDIKTRLSAIVERTRFHSNPIKISNH